MAAPPQGKSAPFRKPREEGKRERMKKCTFFFFLITNTRREKNSHNKTNHPSKQKVPNNNNTTPTETKYHLPFVAGKVAMVLPSGGMGSPRRSPSRPLRVSPRRTRGLHPAGPRARCPGWAQPAAGPPPPPPYKALRESPQDPPVPRAVPGTSVPNPASAP